MRVKIGTLIFQYFDYNKIMCSCCIVEFVNFGGFSLDWFAPCMYLSLWDYKALMVIDLNITFYGLYKRYPLNGRLPFDSTVCF